MKLPFSNLRGSLDGSKKSSGEIFIILVCINTQSNTNDLACLGTKLSGKFDKNLLFSATVPCPCRVSDVVLFGEGGKQSKIIVSDWGKNVNLIPNDSWKLEFWNIYELKTKDNRLNNLLIAFQGNSIAREDTIKVFIFHTFVCKT